MSGTLFIVCIPTEDKEEILKDKDVKNKESPTSLSTINTPKLNGELHKQRSFADRNGAVCLEIEHFGSNDKFQKSPLQRTKSCDNVAIDKNFLGIEDTRLKFRKSLDDNRSRICEKSKKKSRDLLHLQLNILPDSSMELILNKILQKFKVENATWNQSNDMHSVTFSMPSGASQDQVLKLFKYWGIGERPGSSVTMLPCTVILPTKSSGKNDDEVFSEELSAKEQGLWDGFLNSVNARMNVAKIVDELRQDAALTFDYVVLIVIAAIMAAFGLIEDSIICLTSSMLISPLMGPLIAATFSTVIKDNKLMKFGVINGLIGLFLATLVGFVFGLIVGSIDERYGVGDGLGEEILSRCEIHSLVIGAFTAIPSGAAVAIAILGENIASLVGVAISISLLPPAVNAGLLWALALLFMIHQDDENIYNSVIKSTIYSKNQAVELAILGTISMAVTVINVVCIYGTGILFLKIKEVAPMVSKSQEQFWKHDVKVARDYNKTIVNDEGVSLKERLLKDLAQLRDTEFKSLITEAPSGFSNQQHTWSPMMKTNRTSRISIQELEKLYWNPTYTIAENRPTTRLNRVGCLGKSVSPPKYHLLKNDFGIDSRNRNMPSASKSSPQQVLSKAKDNSDVVHEVNEAPRKSSANGRVQFKSKFVVTRVDSSDIGK